METCRMELSREAALVIGKLNDSGYEAYAVGGCVRDFLLGLPPKDFDIATNAAPRAVKAIFRRTVDTGLQHGTVTVLIGNKTVEVTTYRIDGEYTDNRRPDGVTFTNELKDDLTRRDFTINAMAYHPAFGYVDYFGGAEDLAKGLIRGVGAPGERFREDALRMLRAVRFAAVLGFEIENETKAAVYENAHLISNISAERIRDEFLKILTSKNPEILNLLTDTRLLFYFLPPLQEYCEENIGRIINALSRCDKDVTLCLVIFFMYAQADTAEETLTALRLDNRTVKAVLTLKAWLDKPAPKDLYETRKALSIIGVRAFEQLVKLKETISGGDFSPSYEMLKSVRTKGDCFTLKNLAVNGTDLLELGINGKAVGETLNDLLDYVMKNPEDNVKQRLIARL